MKYKNIFITGSTGVVGKPLLKKLIENGHNVYALSRSEENKKILEFLDLFTHLLLSRLVKIWVVLGMKIPLTEVII